MTTLDNLLYVLLDKLSEQIEVYDNESYRLQSRLTVHGLGIAEDIVACSNNRCAYISDRYSHDSIHRLALPNGASATIWPVNDKPACLSVTNTHNVLVTCRLVCKIKEFSTDGKLLRQVQLPEGTASPSHSIQLSSGQFIVSHGDPNHSVHRVCLLSPGGQVVQSFGGPRGTGRQQINCPRHLAVDSNGYVFVSDRHNHRVLLLSSSLLFVREVVSRDQLGVSLESLCFDKNKRLLYVALNENRRGRVVVVTL